MARASTPTVAPESAAAPNDRLLTLAQVKARLQVSHETVYRLMRQGRLKSTKIGRSRRFKESMVDAYVHSLPDLMRKKPKGH